MAIQQIGIDIGKNTFHLVGLDENNAIALRRQLSRPQLDTRINHARWQFGPVALTFVAHGSG